MATIGFALGLWFSVNRPLRDELRGLDVAAALAASGAPAASTAAAFNGGGADFVAEFIAFLPAADMREQQLQTLHGLASRSGVSLSRVAYAHTGLPKLPGHRTTMQLTLQADYAAYRQFLHDLLVALPNLSIDRVTTERMPGQGTEKAGAVDVRVDASLYYRNVSTGRAP